MRVAEGVPVAWLDGSVEPIELARVSPNDPAVAEDLIQQLVFDHPTVLPMQDLDPGFAPLIPIGREVATGVGVIDALFISPGGDLTVVEAKLWRNPQARREVVGQVIDYATALSGWSYEDLDTTCRQATGQGLWDLVSARASEVLPPRESEFVDAVSRGLGSGRFLLLVVGDGIREEVERMAAYVQSAPRLQFHLALVELRIYEAAEQAVRVVVPSVVARTAEVTRAVVRVDVAEETRVGVEVSVPVDDAPRTRRRLTMDQFFDELAEGATPEVVTFTQDVFDDFAADGRFLLERRSASVSLRLKNPAGGGDFTVLVFAKNGRAYPGWLHDQCRKAGVPVEVGLSFVDDLSAIVQIPKHPKWADTLADSIDLAEIAARWDAIAPRIDRLAEEIHQSLG